MDELQVVALISQISSDVQEQTHAINTGEDAQRFVDEVVALVSAPHIDVEVIGPDQAASLGHESPDWKGDRVVQEAFSVLGRRRIYIVDAGQKTLVRGLLLFHEVTHVLMPTPESPHGPQFMRAWLDLMRHSGLYGMTADSIEAACQLVGVPIAADPSPLATTHRRGLV